jgi:hypothetical protein
MVNNAFFGAHGLSPPSSIRSEDGLADQNIIVKFDSDTLPPILNALTTQNGGQKLILEVAVRHFKYVIAGEIRAYFI